MLLPMQPGVRYFPQRVVGLGHRMIRCGMHASSITDLEPVGMQGMDAGIFESGSRRTLNAQCVTRLAARVAGYSAVNVLRNWPEVLRTPAMLACFFG